MPHGAGERDNTDAVGKPGASDGKTMTPSPAHLDAYPDAPKHAGGMSQTRSGAEAGARPQTDSSRQKDLDAEVKTMPPEKSDPFVAKAWLDRVLQTSVDSPALKVNWNTVLENLKSAGFDHLVTDNPHVLHPDVDLRAMTQVSAALYDLTSHKELPEIFQTPSQADFAKAYLGAAMAQIERYGHVDPHMLAESSDPHHLSDRPNTPAEDLRRAGVGDTSILDYQQSPLPDWYAQMQREGKLPPDVVDDELTERFNELGMNPAERSRASKVLLSAISRPGAGAIGMTAVVASVIAVVVATRAHAENAPEEVSPTFENR